MIRGALTGGTGGATQPRQEYAAAGQGECKDMGEDRPKDYKISLWCHRQLGSYAYLPLPHAPKGR